MNHWTWVQYLHMCYSVTWNLSSVKSSNKLIPMIPHASSVLFGFKVRFTKSHLPFLICILRPEGLLQCSLSPYQFIPPPNKTGVQFCLSKTGCTYPIPLYSIIDVTYSFRNWPCTVKVHITDPSEIKYK